MRAYGLAATTITAGGTLSRPALAALAAAVMALTRALLPGGLATPILAAMRPVGSTPALTPAALGPQPIDPLSDGEAFESRLPLSDTTLTGLARNGRMAVQTEAGDKLLRASPRERRMIQGFLSYCASSHA